MSCYSPLPAGTRQLLARKEERRESRTPDCDKPTSHSEHETPRILGVQSGDG
jgi:hypothetical protein